MDNMRRVINESDIRRITKDVLKEHFLRKGCVEEWRVVMEKMEDLWNTAWEFYNKYYDQSNQPISDINELYDEFAAIGEGKYMDLANEFMSYLEENEGYMPDNENTFSEY